MSDIAKNSSSSVIVYSAALSRRLAAGRFPPTCIGLVRRVRPSTHTVKSALHNKQSLDAAISERNESHDNIQHGQAIKFMVIDDQGVERRMTHAEKKLARIEAAKQKKERKKLEKRSQHDFCLKKALANNERYFQLDVDRKLLADELAELKGLRDGVPPVALAPACARQAALQGLLHGFPVSPVRVVFDQDLSNKWALQLKENMSAAERVRADEDMRPMPYQLNPEVWTRMRPDFSVVQSATASLLEYDKDDAWSYGKLQPTYSLPMHHHADVAVIQLLYQADALQVSCGSKFGSDFLLYQGSREDTHAFAGLRIECSESSEKLALPTAYDLSGYVRGLNTAAKLALLATVVIEGDLYRVALVDLALEKIVTIGQNKRAGPDHFDKLKKKK
jgi:hypothetical protein